MVAGREPVLVQRVQGKQFVSLDLLASGQESRAVWGRSSHVSHRCHIFSQRPMGSLQPRLFRIGPIRLRATLSGDGRQVSGLRRDLPALVSDGRELFFRSSQAPLQVVRVTLQPSFEFGNPEPVPAGAGLPFTPFPFPERQYDITPDGKRFIGVVAAGESQGGTAGAPQIQVVLNWLEDLKQRVPVR